MKSKFILLMCALAVIFSGCAAPAKTESGGLKAYRDILQAAPAMDLTREELSNAAFGYEENLALFGNHLDSFAILDLNGDGTPELIAQSVVNFRWAPISVYTYADGKAVLLKDPLDANAHGTFEQNSSANGAYLTYVCGENHIHSVWRGATPVGEEEENYAYILTGTALTLTDCTTGESGKTIYLSDILKSNTAENTDSLG